ncbi:MAG: hypothetical protein FJ115_01200 [Deltaproteobacteria bacterium]|nr:hypothetical protein [Deltaproteobacteria bacterium]MBM4322149.1 hypothetical protein [Deltaproteobacteria bacterium]
MKWFEDIFNRNIRLTDERMEHIEFDHPEMYGQIDKIRETLQNPEIVVRSRSDLEAELFYRYYSETSVGNKYMCVIVKGGRQDPFIITAYFTDTMKRGETLWRKQ